MINSQPTLQAKGHDAAFPPATMTILEACNYARLSRSFLYKLFEQQELRRLQAGKRVLIMKQDLDKYLHSIAEGAE